MRLARHAALACRRTPEVLSFSGAHGLMQIMPHTGEMLCAQLGVPWRGADMLFDPILNVRLGTAYLKEL